MSVPKRQPASKEQAVQAVQFTCPLSKAALDQFGCQEICRGPQTNIHQCVKHECTSPWRFCWACLLCGLGRKSQLVVNPVKGLCEFHLKHKQDAVPPLETIPAFSEPSTTTREIADRLIEREAQKEAQRKKSKGKEPAPKEKKRVAAEKVSPADTRPPLHLVTQPVTPTADVSQVPSPKVLPPLGPIEVGREFEVDCARVVPLKGQPRSYFNKSSMESLKESIKSVGQLQVVPAIFLPDGRFQISDGERRWRTCKELGRPLRILIISALLSEEEEIERSAVSNFNREDHPPFEKARAFHRLNHGPLRRSVKEISEKFGVHPTTVTTYISVFERLNPRVREFLDPTIQGSMKKTLPLNVAIKLVPLSEFPDAQFELATEIMRRQLRPKSAERLINERAVALGIVAKRRGRPRDHFVSVVHIVERLESLFLLMNAEGSERWNEVLAQRPVKDKRELQARLRTAHQALMGLMDGLLHDPTLAKK